MGENNLVGWFVIIIIINLLSPRMNQNWGLWSGCFKNRALGAGAPVGSGARKQRLSLPPERTRKPATEHKNRWRVAVWYVSHPKTHKLCSFSNTIAYKSNWITLLARSVFLKIIFANKDFHSRFNSQLDASANADIAECRRAAVPRNSMMTKTNIRISQRCA